MDSVSKAIALANLGIKVFPVNPKTRAPMLGGLGGVYLATLDPETIATWFLLDYAKAVVGVWTGGSDLLALDLDRGKKNGKDGFKSMADKGRSTEFPETHEYPTPSGGKHVIWDATGTDYAPAQDFDRMEGVDVRASGSYFVWWADEVPESRDAFSKAIPDWIKIVANEVTTFTGEGFSGSVQDWLKAIPDDELPSSGTRYFMERIPEEDFGHSTMVDLAWELVRLGSERETGIKMALGKLHDAWLKDPYNTPQYRKDFDTALRGGINKAGRVQHPTPAIMPLEAAMKRADTAGVGSQIRMAERKLSDKATEVELSETRKTMFKLAVNGGVSPEAAMGLIVNSKAFRNSKVNISSAWFGDGEPQYHDRVAAEEADSGFEAGTEVDPEEDLKRLVLTLSSQAEAFSFLTEDEQTRARAYDWWGKDYLDWVQTRLKHYNKPYHVAAMWAALSTIVSPWGKLPLQGYKLTDCNLYFNVLGESTSGKSEAWGFGRSMVNAYYDTQGHSPIIGDVKRSSALSVHRALLLRDKEPTLLYSDEVQGFFLDIQTSHWQGTMLGDLSDYYGGDVSPKNTMNDKELSGKSAQSLLTVYLTGIADMSLDAISIDHWRSGLFYRFIWGFGEPRRPDDHKTELMDPSAPPDTQVKQWAVEFKRRFAQQKMKWTVPIGQESRRVNWDQDALDRLDEFTKMMETESRKSPLFDNVLVPANGRFKTSVMKCATLIALTELAETVTLDHVLVALDFAGPWHRSMVLAIDETGKTVFDRDCERLMIWAGRNSIKQLDKPPVIQRSAVMRAFRPNETAERMLRQMVEEGRIAKAGDTYEIMEG